MSDERYYSVTEAAKLIGISRETLHRWIRAGKIRIANTTRREKVPYSEIAKLMGTGQLIMQVQSDACTEHVDADPNITLPIVEGANASDMSDGVPSYADARAIREWHQARLAKMLADEKEGRLIDVQAVSKEWHRILRSLRDQLLDIGARVAPRIAGQTNEGLIRSAIDNEIQAILMEVADEITRSVTPNSSTSDSA